MTATKPTKRRPAECFEDPTLTAIAKKFEDLGTDCWSGGPLPASARGTALSGFGSLSTLKIKIRKREFPSPIKISEGRQAWSEREVIEWQRKKIAERNAVLGHEADRQSSQIASTVTSVG